MCNSLNKEKDLGSFAALMMTLCNPLNEEKDLRSFATVQDDCERLSCFALNLIVHYPFRTQRKYYEASVVECFYRSCMF